MVAARESADRRWQAMSVIALIPARSGSKGIPGKNLRELGGVALVDHAVRCAFAARVSEIAVTTDVQVPMMRQCVSLAHSAFLQVLVRPPDLAQDDTPMIVVVQHALAQLPGPPEDIIVLLQPTQPFRTPAHVTSAIRLLQETHADSVVSVVPLPLSHSPELVCVITGDTLYPYPVCEGYKQVRFDFSAQPGRRQDVEPVYRRDGTVYVFWRKTVETYGSLYGYRSVALVIDPDDSCELDTEADWTAVERRWKARHGGT